jgi:drug/metabolite transporter (DMT)-like permease
MMNDAQVRDIGRLALAVGVVAAGSAICLATFYAVQGPFGTINDLGNAATGLLSAAMAWRLRRQIRDGVGRNAVGAAIVGAGLAVVGSSLVVSGTTGFFLAGLVSSVGFAGIGAWLITLNRRAGVAAGWPRGLRTLGIVAGTMMAFGVASAPGILLRLDDMATAPGWVWIGFVGWFGTFLAYPAWAIWLSAVEARLASRPVIAPA